MITYRTASGEIIRREVPMPASHNYTLMQKAEFEVRAATLTYYGRTEKIQEVVVDGVVIGRVRKGFRSLDGQGNKCLRYGVDYLNEFDGFTMRGELAAMSVEDAVEKILNERGLTGR